MATQQLPTSLPPGWESDYDGTTERWFFIHRPTGFSQFFFPKAGDEHTRVAQLAQPQPTNGPANGSLTIKMEAMSISENINTVIPTQEASAGQQQSHSSAVPPPQPTSTPQAVSMVQQSPQGSPLARTVSGAVQRKAIPRRDSVQSQASQSSSQAATQMAPAQQYQPVLSSQSQNTTQIVQNVQNFQQAQQFQQPQQALQTGQMQLVPQLQQGQPTPQYFQNQQPPQTQPVQQYQQFVQTPPLQQNQQTLQHQQVQPLQTVTGQPGQNQILQTPVQSPQSFSPLNQNPQQPGQPQQIQPRQPQQIQKYQNPQVQPQYVTTSPQTQTVHQNTANNQRRFSTIPVLQQPSNVQVVLSPQPGQQQPEETRHSSIGTNNYQSQPLIQQMQPVPAQPGQFVSAPQTFAPQIIQQGGPQTQSPPVVQYVQQNVAPLPPNLPPPAPGMKWVLVQPGTQQSPAQPAQTVQKSFDPNQSPQYSVQMQQFQGGAPVAGTTGRPGVVTRLSSSTMSSSKKAFEASKGFVKKHPGKTIAIVGGLGLVAEACGVHVLQDAVAGSKVYSNVQNAKARKKALNATHNPTHQAAPTIHHVNQSAPHGNAMAPAQMHQGIQQHPQAVHQQNTGTHMTNMVNGNAISHSIGQGGLMNSQPTFLPMHQPSYQQNSHPQFAPNHTNQQHHVPHVPQQFSGQQNGQSTNSSNQFFQNQNSQSQYQQNQQSMGPSNQFFQTQNTQPQYQQNQQSTDPTNQFFQNQNSQPQYQQNQQPTDPSNQFFQNQNSQTQYQQNQQSTSPSNQFFQPQNSQQQYNTQQNPPVQNPSQMYNIQQDNSGQNQGQNSGGFVNYATDAYNMLPGGQGNSPTQSQSPSFSTGGQQQQLPSPSTSPFNAFSQQQQFTAPSTSPFDPSSQQQQFSNASPSATPFDPSQQQFSNASPSTTPFDPSQQQQSSNASPSATPFDPSQQQQQFSNASPSTTPFDPSQQQFSPSTTPFDPSQQQQFSNASPSATPFDPSSQIQQQQFFQDQGSSQMDNQAFDASQQFTPDFSGQGMLNASMLDDNSYVDAPPSPSLVDTGSDYGQGMDANEDELLDDSSAGIF